MGSTERWDLDQDHTGAGCDGPVVIKTDWWLSWHNCALVTLICRNYDVSATCLCQHLHHTVLSPPLTKAYGR